jgi:hypothetical protein
MVWTFDLIEISWGIDHYRTLRHKVLEAHRQAAIESALHHLDAVDSRIALNRSLCST